MKNKPILNAVVGIFLGILLIGLYISILQESSWLTPGEDITRTIIATLQKDSTTIATETISNCNVNDYLGEIAFLNSHNLYLISGHGCDSQLLMENVSDSPAWSPNGSLIAVGCQNDSKLCLIEINREINNGATPDQYSHFLSKIVDLPDNCAVNSIRSISWSSNGDQIAVVCIVEGKITDIYILDLQQDDYKLLLSDDEILRAVWSPVDETIIVSTLKGDIYMVNLREQNSKFLTTGWAPEWSSDGQRIIFIKPNTGSANPQKELAIINLDSQILEWVYLPGQNSEQTNFILGCGDLRFDCRLAWSPDGRYVAIGARHGFMFNWDIFRLDIITEEVINLTENLNTTQNYEPDWSP